MARSNVKSLQFVTTFNELAAQGKQGKEIAEVLGMKVATVLVRASQMRKKGVHIANLKRGGGGGGNRLDVVSLNQAAQEATERGLAIVTA